MNSNLSVRSFHFSEFEKSNYFEEKGGRLVFTFQKFEDLIVTTLFNLQPILASNIPNFKSKHQQFKNGRNKLVSKLVFLLFLNKRVCLVHQVQEGSSYVFEVLETSKNIKTLVKEHLLSLSFDQTAVESLE